ncbi:MAG: hypothetical protein N3D11_03960 [Candidatus Sumerlaeia bacterium]|nr:hypothetical protein [Candidatus Sumerlaeia bacterium]
MSKPRLTLIFSSLSLLFCLVSPWFALSAAPSEPAPNQEVLASPGTEPTADEEDLDDHQPAGLSRLIRFAGKFHPAAVHFPIALIIVAALAELVGLATQKSLYRDSARVMVFAAALTAIPAAALGWATGAFAEYAGALARVLTLHRWLGTAAAALIIVTAIVSEISHRPGRESLKPLYRLLLLASAILIAATGYFGGALVFGLNHYQW